ncbi:MAG: NUDIX hydrolase [Chloroflexi bacterium]|nr:NUDIX hydrolase [Chloroflexota bacterium]
MEHRIRAAALVVSEGKLLLVKSRGPRPDEVGWAPPGGGLEDTESVFQCAIRETLEETGVSIEPVRIVYLRQFVDTHLGHHNLEVYVLSGPFSGTPTTANLRGTADEDVNLEARFLSREDMEGLTVYPEILKGQFWEDLAQGFPDTRYLGLDQV